MKRETGQQGDKGNQHPTASLMGANSRALVRLLFAFGILLQFATMSFGQPLPSKIDFNRDIRPILSNKCFACHGPDARHRKAKLRLDQEKSAKAKRDDGYVIVPGKPASSELVKRITSNDEFTQMPPPSAKKPLTKREIALLTAWVKQGAVWAKHWAYVPPQKHAIPHVKDSAWPLNWTDRFILARLEAEGITPSQETDRVTLIRRVTFDLTGLPPTPDDVRAFVNDKRPGAFERVVDRLLASPAFGERLAVYWLDLVRFADTVGYHGDQTHVVSPYRDYVIDALNANLPFDQFTKEQLAGDLMQSPPIAKRGPQQKPPPLAKGGPQQKPPPLAKGGPGGVDRSDDRSVDRTIASAYNRLLQTSHEGGVQAKEYLAIYAADRIRNVSQVWMGATMGCAQCHDHKYDPFTAKDFYSMQAFFADIDEDSHLRRGRNALPTIRIPELPVLTRRERHRAGYLEREIAKESARSKAKDAAVRKAATRRLGELRYELASLRKYARKTMITKAKKPRTIRLLPRGNWLDDSGPVMQPAVPAFLSVGQAGKPDLRLTRLDLANWLTDRKDGVGGMTARVMANRFWYLAFSRGLSKVLDDFGGQGEPPSHPQLLDNLAIEFVDSGWDVKHMLRLLVTSRAYRQSSNPQSPIRNPQLFASQARYRLPAEMVRDNALAVSGLLVRRLGGPSVKPYQPAGYYRHLNFPRRRYIHDDDKRQWQRGVYVHWQRQFLHPMLKAFDAPSREECTAQRARSNTPIAAMTLLNDPTFLEAARVFAERVLRNGGKTTASRLDYAYNVVLSRSPDQFEAKVMTGLLESRRRYFRSNAKAAEELLSVGIAQLPDGVDETELAAWTAIGRVLLNLNETLTRN